MEVLLLLNPHNSILSYQALLTHPLPMQAPNKSNAPKILDSSEDPLLHGHECINSEL